jgi:hypothetical protein
MRNLPKVVLSVVLGVALAVPVAWAEGLRPLPRPASVERLAAFQGATDLAPRVVARPRSAPAVAIAQTAAPRAAEIVPVAAFAPAPVQVALPIRATTGPARAPDPVADPARALGDTRSVTFSASNAMAPVFVTAALALPRPARRPDAQPAPEVATPAAFAVAPAVRPQPRPAVTPAVAVAPKAPAAVAVAPVAKAFASPRPAPRPKGLAARAAKRDAPARQAPPEQVTLAAAAPRIDPGKTLVVPKSQKGALCGDPAIQGVTLAPITSKVKGCGIANPVRVTHVDGVRLSTPATLDCDTARALRQWVTTGLKPAAGKAGVAEIRVAAHYACRSRNNVKGARISEHGRGKAIDIAGITLANGKALTVLGDYRRAEMLQKVRRAACGIFGTTLGPGSDRFHSDHFHFDTARHRNGPYCR